MSQKNEDFETPAIADIVGITRDHVAAMEASTDPSDEIWMGAGMPHLVLRTVGRRSGEARKAALPYWITPDGETIVVASYAGADRHPAWYLNLCDREANPEVWARKSDGAFFARADVLDPAEREKIWALLVADRPFYTDYQAATSRTIPLVRLVKLRNGGEPST